MDAARKRSSRRAPQRKSKSLATSAFDKLRAEIIRCALPPGSEITEGSVCAQYGFSKAPVRAALLKLSQEGLVRAVPRRGYVIAPVTIKNVQEMFELRLILEPAIARLAAGRVDAETLRRLNVPPGFSKAEQSEMVFLSSNREFHLAIARASGSGRLVSLMTQLLDDMARLLHLGLFSADWRSGAMHDVHREQAKQHDDLIEALVNGDADAAEAAARTHVVESRDLVMRALLTDERALTVARVGPRHETIGV